jgi:ABC-2 type transport system permease protein
VGPYAVASTAVLGGGAGLVAIGSLVCPQPLDQAGNPTPAWSLKVHVALLVVPLTALPTAAVLAGGGGWLAVLAGVLTGAALTAWLGRLAVTRLAAQQVAILHALARAA